MVTSSFDEMESSEDELDPTLSDVVGETGRDDGAGEVTGGELTGNFQVATRYNRFTIASGARLNS